jgi:hypothetical protein
MKGYKIVNQVLAGLNTQWVIGVKQVCQFNEPHKVFKNGFHFTQVPVFCLFATPSHLAFASCNSSERPLKLVNNMPKPELKYRYVEVEASGDILTNGDVMSASELTITREISSDEWDKLCTGVFTNSSGTQYTIKNGLFNNENGHAIENTSGHKMWFREGVELKKN